MRLITERKLSVTAAFVYNDITAAGMIYEAQKMGMKIPEEISVLGIDDLQVCKMVNPNITTIAQPRYEQGEVSASMLLEMINKRTVADSVLEPFLIERESCCSLNKVTQ